MTNQTLNQKYTKNLQFYIEYKFSLYDLKDLVPNIRTLAIETNEIEISESKNFTFDTDSYILRIPKSQDNQKRILYYSLLCYLFEVCNDSQASHYIEEFVRYVLNNSDVILPYKGVSSRTQKTSALIMTTNQIKSSFAKFMDLLKMRVRKSKMVLEEISSIPQMDFVFMSIFQMYLRKIDNSNEDCLEKFLNQIGICIDSKENGFILNKQFAVEKKSSLDEWDRFLIKKIDQRKIHNKVPIELKRKDTTQSLGQVDEMNIFQTEKQINDALHYDELINARFVESCQGEDVRNLQNNQNEESQKRGAFFAIMKEKISIKKQQSLQFSYQTLTVEKAQPALRPKRTSFLNENMSKSKIHHFQKQKSRNKPIKNDVSNTNLLNSKCFNKITGNYRPWSPKQERIEDKNTLFTSKKIHEVRNTLKSSNIFKNSLISDVIREFQSSPQQDHAHEVRFPQKRQTFQKLTFNYVSAHLRTM